MKRCPKCNRTFPDEAQRFCTVDGGLLITDPAFDPNLTVRATSAELHQAAQSPPDPAATSRELPDMGETVAIQPNAATAVFPRTTGPTGVQTASNLAATVAQPPPEPAVGATTHHPAPQKKSKLPLIIGALAVVFLLGIGGLVAVFFFVIQPRLAQMQERPAAVVEENEPAVETNPNTAPEETTTPAPETETEAPYVPSDGLVKFENSKDDLTGRLAEHYVPFSFYYPRAWQTDPTAGGPSNFVKVERRLPPDFTQENFAVGWYDSKGTFEADNEAFPRLVEKLSASLANNLPEYRKVSEGPTTINSREAYEFRFVSLSKGTEKGDIQVWGRVVFLPLGVPGQTTGATLIMFTTSLAPELNGVQDVGQKGEMPVILESFRFGTAG